MYPTDHDSSTTNVDKSLYDEAKRLLHTLTPKNASKLKTDERFWTRQVLELFFVRCEFSKFDRPAKVLDEMKDLADWVRLIPVGSEPDALRSEAERLSWRVRCLALEAEVAGLAGCRARMQEAIEEATAAADHERIQTVAVAELLRRRAALAMRDGEFDDAARLIHWAEGFYRQLDPDLGLGEALILYGLVKNPMSDGLVAVTEALCRVSPHENEYAGRLFDAGLSMLLGSHAWQTTDAHCEAMLGWLHTCRKKWFSGLPKDRRKLMALWAEARVLMGLRLEKVAQRRLNTVLRGFSELGLFEHMTVSALDLASVWIRNEEIQLAKETLQATRDRLKQIDGDSELNRSLDKALEKALEKVSERTESITWSEILDARQDVATRFLPSTRSFLTLHHPCESLT